MEIVIKHWMLSPYAICFFMSFACAYTYVALRFRKYGILKRYIFYMMLLNTVLILYFGLIYTNILQLIQGEKPGKIGFSSLGGVIGMMLGIFIFSRIVPDYKMLIIRENVKALGLMYAISKLGCFFAGCCHGIKYDGIGKIRYIDIQTGTKSVWCFPVQIVETICFLVVFIIIAIIDNYFSKNDINGRARFTPGSKLIQISIEYICVTVYAGLKFVLDYLRYYSHRNVFSANQWGCLIVIVITFIGSCIHVAKSNDHKWRYKKG